MNATRVRAFVAGASGYTGRAVVAALRERDVETLAHVRPDSARLEEWRARFSALGAQVDTTAWQPDAMRETIFRFAPDVIFALLGTTRTRARRTETSAVANTYEAVDYGLTRMLLDAAAASRARPRFVFLSSTGVSSRARGAYLEVRGRLERELRESGVPYVIARPSIITGADRDERRPLEHAAARVTDTLLDVAAAVGARRLAERYRSTDAETLARALVRLGLDTGARDIVVESEGLRA